MCSNNLEYYVSPNYFFAGRNSPETAMLSSYRIHNPEDYIISWLEMSVRPRYFVGDGDQFANVLLWQALLPFGLSVKVIETTCPQSVLSVWCDYWGRSLPHLWSSISKWFAQLTAWVHPQVQHVCVNTNQHTSFEILQDVIIPLLNPVLPPSKLVQTTYSFNNTHYKVHQHLLPTNIVAFLSYYAQQQKYLKEEGLVEGVVRTKARGIIVEGNYGCGIAYRGMSVDPICMHPMIRYEFMLYFL